MIQINTAVYLFAVWMLIANLAVATLHTRGGRNGHRGVLSPLPTGVCTDT